MYTGLFSLFSFFLSSNFRLPSWIVRDKMKQGFILRKADGFGWCTFTKVCVGYYNDILKDTKFVKRREAFYCGNKIKTRLSRWKPSQKIQKKERSVKKIKNYSRRQTNFSWRFLPKIFRIWSKLELFGRVRRVIVNAKKKQKATVKKAGHITKFKLNAAKKGYYTCRLMSPKGSCQESSKGESKLESYGPELATYFWGFFSKFRYYNHWMKHIVLIMQIINDERKQIWTIPARKDQKRSHLKHQKNMF